MAQFLGVTAVAALYSMALTSSGRVYAWGNNNQGDIGVANSGATNCENGNTYCVFQPVTPTGLDALTVSAIGGGGDFALALTNDNRLFSWGNADLGRLGRFGPDTCHTGGPCAYSPAEVVLLPHDSTSGARRMGA